MKHAALVGGLCLAITFVVATSEFGYAAQKATTPSNGTIQKRKILPTAPVDGFSALTDNECRQLGCTIHLDKNCQTDFGDGIPKTGHKCVCSSGSACIDKAY